MGLVRSRYAPAWWALLVALAQGAGPQIAQAQAIEIRPEAVSGVMVKAPKPKAPQQARAEAISFIKTHGVPAMHGEHVPSWRAGLCPIVAGLTDQANAFVAQRLQAVAKRVDAPVEPLGHCKPNVEIFFTPEPDAIQAKIEATNSTLLGLRPASREPSAGSADHAIRAWYVTGKQGDVGEPLIDQRASGYFGDVHDLNNAPKFRGGNSRLVTGWSTVLINVVIVADTNRVAKLPLDTVADYMAELALSRATDLNACGDLPSLFDLLASHCDVREKPNTLTPTDLAYLKALYATDPNHTPSMQPKMIADKMVEDLK